MLNKYNFNKLYIEKHRSNLKNNIFEKNILKKKNIFLKIEIHSYCSIKSSALSILGNRNFIKTMIAIKTLVNDVPLLHC